MTDRQLVFLCILCSLAGLGIILYANSIYIPNVCGAGSIKEGDAGKTVSVGGVVDSKHYTGEHLFFDLVDDSGKIRAVVFENTIEKTGLNPNKIENGMEIGLRGRLEKYEGMMEIVAEEIYLE